MNNEYFMPSLMFRWNKGILEQMHQGSQGTQIWKPIERINDDD